MTTKTTTSTLPKRKRAPGAGRPPVGGRGTETMRVNAHVTRPQHEKYLALGGAAWLRAQIDAAPLPDGSV